MLTVQIITKNNQKTISRALESIAPLSPHVIIADQGSHDSTLDICEAHHAEIVSLCKPRNKIREMLSDEGWNFIIEPWEILASGAELLHGLDGDCHYVSILNGKIITKEIRVWRGKKEFKYPIFEQLNTETDSEIDLLLYSFGLSQFDAELLKHWKQSNPITLPQPYYYEACMYFNQQKYDEFLNAANHYLFLSPPPTITHIMTRYYCAYVYLTQKRKVRPALQNINICLSAHPLMAEFWCLMADVYYHLLHKFAEAKEFYENAMLLGRKRLKKDKWPMDISKYKTYPAQMIQSCAEILQNAALYGAGSLLTI